MSLRSGVSLWGLEHKDCVADDELVIEIRWGGLGDHLFFSHIPRIAKETGHYKKVFISMHSEYKSSLYKALVWDSNPYIDGFTTLRGWYPGIRELLSGANLLDMIMLGYGLDDGKRLHEPEVYFKPIVKTNLKGLTIYDPNFITNAGVLSERDISKYFKREGVKVDAQLMPLNNSLPLKGIPFINSASLEEYCSIIISCENFYCLTSGGATLAAGLRKKAHVLYGARVKQKFHHSPQHSYIFIKSIKSALSYRVMSKIKRRIRNLYFLTK